MGSHSFFLVSTRFTPLCSLPSAKIEELLKNLKERYTIVIVTHNLAQAKRIADDVAFFQNGRRVETKDAETFWEKPECEETKEFLKG